MASGTRGGIEVAKREREGLNRGGEEAGRQEVGVRGLPEGVGRALARIRP